MNIKKTNTFNCDAAELWSWLVEFEKIKKWNCSIIDKQDVSTGQASPGFKSKMLLKEGKKSVWYDSEILEYNPPSNLKMELRGGSLGKSPMFVEHHLKQNGGQVTHEYVVNWEPKGFLLKLFHKSIAKASSKNMDNEIITLRENLENQ